MNASCFSKIIKTRVSPPCLHSNRGPLSRSGRSVPLTLRGLNKAPQDADVQREDGVFWAHMLNENICAVKGQAFISGSQSTRIKYFLWRIWHIILAG